MQRLGFGDEPPAVVSAPAPLPPATIGPLLLPTPQLELMPIHVDENAFTVWGVAYYLRSRHHHDEVAGKRVTVTGYVSKSNLEQAPQCAVHRGGVADPENCRAPIPAFWIADRPDASEEESIKVMGFASNFAQLFDAIRELDSDKPSPEHFDEFWGVKTPNPLPALGAKVTVLGRYGATFTKASSGAEHDDVMGLLDLEELQTLEPAPVPATLPGVKRKPRRP